jgi:hypothetical protein
MARRVLEEAGIRAIKALITYMRICRSSARCSGKDDREMNCADRVGHGSQNLLSGGL